jgi:hypothetical protein
MQPRPGARDEPGGKLAPGLRAQTGPDEFARLVRVGVDPPGELDVRRTEFLRELRMLLEQPDAGDEQRGDDVALL